MQDLIEEINDVQGVKSVKRRSGPTLKVNLYSREIPGREAEELQGDLRKISPKIRHRLEQAREKSLIDGWNWIQKPEKKYDETGIRTEKISDRREVGHKPPFYTISIEE